jgi:uncharacterized membrane protein YedE/YeeE
MNKSELPDRRLFLLLIALGACARLVPHPWNFTPMMAIGLYAGARTTKVWAGILLTVAALLLSDAVLGFYSGMLYVYAASLVPVLLASRGAQGQESASLRVPHWYRVFRFLSLRTQRFGPQTISTRTHGAVSPVALSPHSLSTEMK